ncbi:MAG: DUF488 domain-containing protein [Roseimicrobium sp.]
MIRTKSADEMPSRSDGVRLYVTRFWPRGHGKGEADAWLPNLAPSEKLLRQFQKGEVSWAAFSRAYKVEMTKGYGDEGVKNPRMKNAGQKHVLKLLKLLADQKTVTLICSCAANEKHCHRHLLRALLEA